MKRGSGVLMHVSSLWGDYSEGSFGREAMEWVDFLASCGFSWWQVLPFCMPDRHNSPYKSFSAFSGNPYLIDLPTLQEQGLITREELAAARQKSPYLCEFDRLQKERLTLLACAARRFSDWNAVDDFLHAHPQMDAFCRFMALRAANQNRPWNTWTVQTPDAEQLRLWRFIQYTFYTQWMRIKAYANRRGIRIIGDIPIYVDWDSADVWANPGQFLLDARQNPAFVAGVPPDYFCADGQLWGNPLYDWDAMERDGFRWWRQRIADMTELFDGVRIDHFRGIESYFRIDADAKTARDGVWVKGPGMKLIHAMRQTTDRLLIAEDLGVITQDVMNLVRDSGFPGMRVFQFGFLGEENSPHLPHNYGHNCIAYTGTHDNNTLLGYIWETEPAVREQIFAYCGCENGTIHNCYDAILRTMFASHAGLLVLPIQDLLLYGRDTRINTPGSSEGNWAYRLTREQLHQIDRDKFLQWNRLYARA